MDQRDDALPGEGDVGNRLETYLHPGEELLISSEKIGIKKFLFTACLSNRRLFLIDQKETRAGVTAKEIPIEYIIERYLDLTPGMDPVLVLSVRTSDDDLRTMKLRFIQSGPDRTPEVEQWMVMFREGGSRREGPSRESAPAPVLTQERPAAPTMVWPGEPEAPPAPRVETVVIAVPPPSLERTPVPAAPSTEQRLAPAPAPVPERRAEPAGRPTGPARSYEPAPVPRTQPPSGTGEVLFCYHCGKKIPPMANFCPYCGTPTHEPSRPANGYATPATAAAAPRGMPPIPQEKALEKPKRRSFWQRFRGKE